MRYMTVSIRDYLDDENLLCGILKRFHVLKIKILKIF